MIQVEQENNSTILEFTDNNDESNWARNQKKSSEDFLKTILPYHQMKFHYHSHPETSYVVELPHYDFAPTLSQFILALHQSFAKHIGFTLSINEVTNVITHEIGLHVKKHSSEYANIFTNDPSKKQNLNVNANSFSYDNPNNDWTAALKMFLPQLKGKMNPELVNLFVPTYSCGTDITKVSNLINLMDAVSKYYTFSVTTMCGIPKIKIIGNESDWEKLIKNLNEFKKLFPKLNGYFEELIPVISQIHETVKNGRVTWEGGDFWKSIYKWNEQSGGDTITGWVNALFAHYIHHDYRAKTKEVKLKENFDWQSDISSNRWSSGYKTNQYPNNVSIVPFTWKYLGNDIPMIFAGGLLSTQFENGYLTPTSGFSIIEPK